MGRLVEEAAVEGEDMAFGATEADVIEELLR